MEAEEKLKQIRHKTLQRVNRCRARFEAEGKVRVYFWIKKSQKDKLKKLVDKLNKKAEDEPS